MRMDPQPVISGVNVREVAFELSQMAVGGLSSNQSQCCYCQFKDGVPTKPKLRSRIESLPCRN